MHKVVILIEPLPDREAFEDAWPEFLHQVEAVPGLVREAASHVDLFLYGHPYEKMHELFFADLESARQALASPPGQAAGRILQAITGGKMTLFFAEYKEDDLENIRRSRQGIDETP